MRKFTAIITTVMLVLLTVLSPTFDVVIEILDRDGYAIHHDVAKTVDLLLRGIPPRPEVRRRSVDGEIKVIEKEKFHDQAVVSSGVPENHRPTGDGNSDTIWISPDIIPERYGGILRLYPYAVSRNRIENAIRDTGLPVVISKDLGQADIVLTLKGQYRKMPKTIREAERRGLPIHIIRRMWKRLYSSPPRLDSPNLQRLCFQGSSCQMQTDSNPRLL
jgi:hypothetical protein